MFDVDVGVCVHLEWILAIFFAIYSDRRMDVAVDPIPLLIFFLLAWAFDSAEVFCC